MSIRRSPDVHLILRQTPRPFFLFLMSCLGPRGGPAIVGSSSPPGCNPTPTSRHPHSPPCPTPQSRIPDKTRWTLPDKWTSQSTQQARRAFQRIFFFLRAIFKQGIKLFFNEKHLVPTRKNVVGAYHMVEMG